MPTYDYLCENCQHTFEEFQSITADPLKKCPKCGKNKLKRLMGTGAGIIFKGSGFYETDYRSESYKSGQKKAKSTSTNTGPSKKSETKSETKTETKAKPATDNKSKKTA